MTEDWRIRAAVDRLLLEQGYYDPLELLLELGALPFDRYEAWRCGELEVLVEALAGRTADALAQLRVAAAWAEHLGLEPSLADYRSWGPRAGRSLHLARAPRADGLLRTQYRRPAGGEPQLDLFLDSGPTLILNRLAAALAARDLPLAERHLEVLRDRFPDHPHHAAADRLTNALRDLQEGAIGDPVEEEADLADRLAPTARALLGHRAPAFMAPFWRRLGRALEGRPYAPLEDRLHASHAYALAMDWHAVHRSVLATGDPADHPLLLARLAVACRHLDRSAEAIAHWCALCWRHPTHAETVLDGPDLTDPLVRRAWERFQRLDQELETPWFPAWLLIQEPGLARVLDLAHEPRDGPQRAFHAVRQLLTVGADLPDGGLSLRRALQQEHPDLLPLYLERHAR